MNGLLRSANGGDSVRVARFDRASGEVEVLCKLRRLEEHNQRVVPLSKQDDWAVASDGRVAAIRAADYSIEWLNDDGNAIEASPTVYVAQPIRIAEKERWHSEVSTNGLDIAAFNRGGEFRVVVRRGAVGGGAGTGINAYEWPRTLPPFRFGRSMVSPDGHLWVERFVQVGDQPRIDLFDGSGTKVGELTLPHGRRLVRFGRGSVFLIFNDEVDLQRLERYRIPAGH